jgi:DNA invertase Pin-like site-specific DNA recombinase
VYKVDRLSRSLLDFARIIKVLDKNGVSFVAVTPAVQHDEFGRF